MSTLRDSRKAWPAGDGGSLSHEPTRPQTEGCLRVSAGGDGEG